ncbi:Inositol-1-monophosphatase [Mycetocola reblochoni REB411]|uniref:Inositol-1-monophosphatase n=1 Tax=Mycetocola reblochoni REB411 TaxID=1255698 RepID=A0A1R4JW24_9MICO|nr:Inositol-1-monophosphatase [Mycetocola reblochoni REB411]
MPVDGPGAAVRSVPGAVDAEGLAGIAERIAVRAAELVARRRRDGVSVAATKSNPVDIVTAVDRESEDLIRELILAERPSDGFFGEESGGSGTGTSGLTWVVDPIDGTVNYLYGIPDYAVSIAVVRGEPDPRRWEALAAVVVNAATGEVFRAVRGGGATRDGVPLRVNSGVPVDRALIGTGFGYDPRRRVWQAGLVRELLAEVRDIRRLGSAALDLCYLAQGRIDGFFERGLQPWDHAAGALVAAEAGARVEGLNGAPASSDFLLAAEEGLFSALHERLVAAGADDTSF